MYISCIIYIYIYIYIHTHIHNHHLEDVVHELCMKSSPIKLGITTWSRPILKVLNMDLFWPIAIDHGHSLVYLSACTYVISILSNVYLSVSIVLSTVLQPGKPVYINVYGRYGYSSSFHRVCKPACNRGLARPTMKWWRTWHPTSILVAHFSASFSDIFSIVVHPRSQWTIIDNPQCQPGLVLHIIQNPPQIHRNPSQIHRNR